MLHENSTRIWLRFKAADRGKIMAAMKEDLSMLKKFNMMDYSLLLCVQENPRYSALMSEHAASGTQ